MRQRLPPKDEPSLSINSAHQGCRRETQAAKRMPFQTDCTTVM